MKMLERGVPLQIGEREHTLLLTVNAASELIGTYGGLDKAADGLKSDCGEGDYTLLMEMVALLANQSIMLKNEREGTDEPLLSARRVALEMAPYELQDAMMAVLEAFIKGGRRHIVSEDAGRPTTAG